METQLTHFGIARRQSKPTNYLGEESRFLGPFLEYYQSYTDGPPIFGLGIGLLFLGMKMRRAKTNLSPSWGRNIFLLMVGKTGQARKTTTLGLLDVFNIPRIPFGTAEATIHWLAQRDHGAIVVDEASALLKRCQRPGYLEGFSEFCNRVYDRSRLELNTRKSGLIQVGDHYVSLVLSTTDEGFRASVSPEMLRNGFMGRFLPLIGESVPRPRSLSGPDPTKSKGLKARLERLNGANVAFKHSERTASLASSITSIVGLDDWLAARAEEHVLQVADLFALDRSVPLHLLTDNEITIEVTESDVLRGKEFVSAALSGFQRLVRITRIPHGALLDLYQSIPQPAFRRPNQVH